MNNILKINNLNVYTLKNKKEILKNINLEVKKREIVGIVGESGAGKSTLINVIASFLNEKIFGKNGEIFLETENLMLLENKERRKICMKSMSIIPQDAINSLNPYERIGKQLIETYLLHNENIKKKEAIENIDEILKKLNFNDTKKIYRSYPSELSGGMKQRIVIALSLFGNKKILLADEPTTSLDAINQYRFIKILKDICMERELSLLYISHDIRVLSQICDRIIVMKSGEILEDENVENILKNPKNKYTKELINKVIGEISFMIGD